VGALTCAEDANGANGTDQPGATPSMNQPLNRPLGDTSGANGANGANRGANQPLDSSVSSDPLNNSLATNQTRKTRMLTDKPLPPIRSYAPLFDARSGQTAKIEKAEA